MNDSYKMAISNIAKKGDTDIFPFPVENPLFYDKPAEIERLLQDIERNYNKLTTTAPIECIKTCVPVGYTGFRWATLIDPVWNAYFLAEVLKISEQIEAKRIPVEGNSIFSYRIKFDEEAGTLFDHDVNWRAFYRQAGEFSGEYKYVITFDIADFYNRIYHERLRSVLHTEVGADGNLVDRIMDLISRIATGNDSYGLPIGGNASRILAEALLIRSDNFMKEKGIKFCRFVDDYIVFADSLGNAYSILNSCADYFQRTMGLSLQKNKTTIMTRSEFKLHIKSVFDEIESDKDSARTSILNLKLTLDPYAATADEDLRDLKDKIDGSGLIRLLKSECRKTKINQMFGKQLVRAVKFLDEENLPKAFDVLSHNFEKLYPIFPVVMRTTYKTLLDCKDQAKINDFIDKIAELVDNNSYIIQSDNNASYAIRVLSLVKSKRSEQAISILFERLSGDSTYSSPLLRMNAIYAMTNHGNSGWLSGMLQAFPKLSPWERRAVVASAAFLGDTGNTWRSTFRNYFTPVENLIADWTFEQYASKQNWKLPL
jgi:hypothetical protein